MVDLLDRLGPPLNVHPMVASYLMLHLLLKLMHLWTLMPFLIVLAWKLMPCLGLVAGKLALHPPLQLTWNLPLHLIAMLLLERVRVQILDSNVSVFCLLGRSLRSRRKV